MNFRAKREAEEIRIRNAELRLAHHNKTASSPPVSTVNYLDIVGPYREFFIANEAEFKSKLKSDNSEKKLIELVRYLFCKYRVSPQFLQLWLRKLPNSNKPVWGSQAARKSTLPDEDLIRWFICVAQGGSLYKTYSKKYLTKMETHILITCPHELTFEQTLVFAVAKTFAPTDGLALRLAHSKLSTIQYTEFVKTIIYFFAKNPPKSVEEVNDLVDFILNKHHASNGAWSLAGRTLESLRQKCSDWHYELRRIKAMGNHTWEGAPLPDTMIQTGSEKEPLRWHFTQIKSSRLLAEEGTKMRHCVYTYKGPCMRGDTYIWSLSREEFGGLLERKVTIELSNAGSIVQARGLANRTMRSEERHVVQIWARNNGLSLSC